MTSASPAWQQQAGRGCGTRTPRRGLEMVGIVFGFFWFWPAAAAYIAWKVLGYPGLGELRGMVERGTDNVRGYRFTGPGFSAGRFATGSFTGFSGTGNRAFDEYRRGEIDRLEQERRRLDTEAREFRDFVEELKHAKDREEFDAYMARRRANGPTTA